MTFLAGAKGREPSEGEDADEGLIELALRTTTKGTIRAFFSDMGIRSFRPV